MRVGINILGLERWCEHGLASVLDLTTIADEAGIDLISTGDHLGFNAPAHRQRVEDEGFLFPLDHHWFEPLTLLAAVAARTRSVQLGVSVIVAPLRPALLLAKQVATLDVISAGRASIGVGVGWQQAEYTASGVPFERRFGRMEEQIAACRELWSNPPSAFRGTDFEFDDFHSLPLPVQSRVPVLFGLGPSRRNFERIARVGDGWTANPADMSAFGSSVELLRTCFTEHGRDPDEATVQVSVPPIRTSNGSVDFDATARQVAELGKAGATTAVLRPAAFEPEERDLPTLVRWIADLGSR